MPQLHEQFTIQSKKLQALRNSTASAFSSAKWPTRQDEEWRRSDAALFPFEKLEAKTATAALSEDELSAYASFQSSLEAVVGTLQAQHSAVQFYAWSDEGAEIASMCLQHSLDYALDKVDLWRLSQFSAGGVLRIPKGIDIQEVISLSLHGLHAESVLAPQLVILVDEGAGVSIDIELAGDAFFSMGIYCVLAEKAHCRINQLQNTSLDSYVINSLVAECKQESNFSACSGQLGSMMSVDRVYAYSTGTLSNINLNGYYFPIEDQLVDLRTYQKHIAEDSNSRSLYHGVGLDQSHSVYRGLIEVGLKATETDAYLTNNNLLLSEEARMDSIPCLNILTNDVRCSHGATMGTLNEDHIFYLKSRGLSDSDAKELLIEGFFQAVFDDYFEVSNEKARAVIRQRIRGANL